MLVAFDIEQMRPACVLVAAAMGADTRAAMAFDNALWLLTPTPAMRVYECTDAQLRQLVSMSTIKQEDRS